MRVMKKGIENTIISMILISFIFLTTILVKDSPKIFCKFICWLGSCEDNIEIVEVVKK